MKQKTPVFNGEAQALTEVRLRREAIMSFLRLSHWDHDQTAGKELKSQKLMKLQRHFEESREENVGEFGLKEKCATPTDFFGSAVGSAGCV